MKLRYSRIRFILVAFSLFLANGLVVRPTLAQSEPDVPNLLNQRAHINSIDQILYSPNQKQILTASTGGLIVMWNADDYTFEYKIKEATDVVFSSTGKDFAYTSWSYEIHLVDSRTGKVIRKRALDAIEQEVEELSFVTGIAFIDQDRQILVSKGQHIYKWDIKGDELTVLFSCDAKIEEMAVHPNECFIAITSDRENLTLLDRRDGSIVLESKESGWIRNIEFAPTKPLLVMSISWHGLWLLDVESKKRVMLSMTEGNEDSYNPYAVAFNSDSSLMASCSLSKPTAIWDVEKAKQVGDLGDVNMCNDALSFRPDGKALAVAGGVTKEPQARIFDLESKSLLGVLHGKCSPIRTVQFVNNDQAVLMASESGCVTTWDKSNGNVIERVEFDNKVLTAAYQSKVDSRLVACFIDGLGIQETSDRNQIEMVGKLDFWPNDFCISPDGKFFAACSYGQIKICDVETAKIFATTGPLGLRSGERTIYPKIRSVAFHPDNKSIVVAGGYAFVFLWSVEVEKLRKKFKVEEPRKHVNRVCVSPDGKTFAAGMAYGDVVVREIGSEKNIRKIPGKRNLPYPKDKVLQAVSFIGNQLIAVALQDKAVTVYDAKTGVKRFDLEGHHGRINCIAASSDGSQILTGSQDGTAILWSAEDGRRIRVFSSDKR